MEQTRNMMAEALLGQGMARRAANSMQLIPIYKQYRVDAETRGEEVLPFGEWTQLYQRQSMAPSYK